MLKPNKVHNNLNYYNKPVYWHSFMFFTCFIIKIQNTLTINISIFYLTNSYYSNRIFLKAQTHYPLPNY